MIDLTGRVALVTGGASGIGRATAERLLERGAAVAIADVSSRGEDVAKEIGARFVHLDVADLGSWQSAGQYVTELFGHLDLLHLNAGVNSPPTGAPFGDDPMQWITPAAYNRVRGVNLDGVVFGVMACMPILQNASHSDILITGSVASVDPLVPDPLYSLTKYGVVGLARSLAPTAATLGVRVQVVCPGGVDTAIVPSDARIPGRIFSPPSYLADAMINALEIGEPGDMWVATQVGLTPWRYTYAPIR